jgi:glycosyltransferase involved in cell wall biosynthesis
MPMKISVIISAYDNWRALDWTLLGYRLQSRLPDELIVAEDSAFAEVAQVVRRHQAATSVPILHLTQADRGFRKCLALNRAIEASSADWLIFTDADCVPRADLVRVHENRARHGMFLSCGSHVNLPLTHQQALLSEPALRDQTLFDRGHLRTQGVAVPGLRLIASPVLTRVMDWLTPRNAFVGCNAGAWRNDLLAVRGFDETMDYGAEDLNLGVRLNNFGIRGVRARYSLVWLHLDHARSYGQAEQVRRNKEKNARLRRSGEIFPERSCL